MKKITKMKNWLPALLLLLTVFLIAQDENISKSNPGTGSWSCVTDIEVIDGPGPDDQTVCTGGPVRNLSTTFFAEQVLPLFTNGDKKFTSSGGTVLFESCAVPFAKSDLDWSIELPAGKTMAGILSTAGVYIFTLKGTPTAKATERIAPCTVQPLKYTFNLIVLEGEWRLVKTVPLGRTNQIPETETKVIDTDSSRSWRGRRIERVDGVKRGICVLKHRNYEQRRKTTGYYTLGIHQKHYRLYCDGKATTLTKEDPVENNTEDRINEQPFPRYTWTRWFDLGISSHPVACPGFDIEPGGGGGGGEDPDEPGVPDGSPRANTGEVDFGVTEICIAIDNDDDASPGNNLTQVYDLDFIYRIITHNTPRARDLFGTVALEYEAGDKTTADILYEDAPYVYGEKIPVVEPGHSGGGHHTNHGSTIDFQIVSSGKVGTITLKGICDPDLEIEGNGAPTTTPTLKINFVKLDLSIDSNNDDIIDEEDDKIETDIPGKIIVVNNSDTDEDSFPDFADGYDFEFEGEVVLESGADKSKPFTPIKVDTLGIPEDVEIYFEYNQSDPKVITKIDNFIHSHLGSLRLWSKNGNQARNSDSINSSGDFIPSEERITVKDLRNILGGTSGTLYVEATEKNDSDHFLKIKIIAPDCNAEDTVTICPVYALDTERLHTVSSDQDDDKREVIDLKLFKPQFSSGTFTIEAKVNTEDRTLRPFFEIYDSLEEDAQPIISQLVEDIGTENDKFELEFASLEELPENFYIRVVNSSQNIGDIELNFMVETDEKSPVSESSSNDHFYDDGLKTYYSQKVTHHITAFRSHDFEATTGVSPSAQRAIPTPYMSVASEINIHNREVNVNHLNQSLTALKIPVTLGQTYRSINQVGHQLGKGWSASWNKYFVVKDNGQILFHAGNGRVDVYSQSVSSYKGLQNGPLNIPTGYVQKASLYMAEAPDDPEDPFKEETACYIIVTYADGSQATFAGKRNTFIKIELYKDRFGNKIDYEYNKYDLDETNLPTEDDATGEFLESEFLLTEENFEERRQESRLEAITDDTNIKYTFTYTGEGNDSKVQAINDGRDITFTYAYNSDNQLQSIEAKGGADTTKVSYSYNSGFLESVKTADNNEYIQFSYDNSQKNTRSNLANEVADVSYGQSSIVESFVKQDGAVVHTDTNGVDRKYIFSNTEKPYLASSCVLVAKSLTTSYEYNNENFLTQTTFPEGNISKNSYLTVSSTDKRQNDLVTSSQMLTGSYSNPSGANTASLSNSFSYEDETKHFQLKTSTAVDGSVTTYIYGGAQETLTEIKNPVQTGHTSSFSVFDDKGRLQETTSVDAAVMVYQYFSNGATQGYLEKTTLTYKNGNNNTHNLVTSFARDPYGRATKITDARGAVSDFDFDIFGQLQNMKGHEAKQGTSASRPETINEYDPKGLLLTSTVKNPVPSSTGTYSNVTTITTNEYDNLARLKKTSTPVQNDNGETTYTYETGKARLKRIDYPNDHYSISNYDNTSWMIGSENPLSTSRKVFNDNGLVIDLYMTYKEGNNAEFHEQSMELDFAGRLVKGTDEISGNYQINSWNTQNQITTVEAFDEQNLNLAKNTFTFHANSDVKSATDNISRIANTATFDYTRNQAASDVTSSVASETLHSESEVDPIGGHSYSLSNGIETHSSNDEFGQIKKTSIGPEVNLNGADVTTYNQAGLVINSNRPELPTSPNIKIQHSAFGNGATVTDEIGIVNNNKLDQAANVTSSQEDGINRKTDFYHDRDSRVAVTVREDQTTKVTYDNLGRTIRVDYFYGVSTTSAKSIAGKSSSIYESASYDFLSRVKTHRKKDGRVFSYEYYSRTAADPQSRDRIKQILVNGQTLRSFADYNRFGSAEKVTDLVSSATISKVETTLEFYKNVADKANFGSMKSETTTLYDQTGTSISTSTKTISRSNDGLGRHKETIYPSGEKLVTSYVNGSLVEGISRNGSRFLSYGRDANFFVVNNTTLPNGMVLNTDYLSKRHGLISSIRLNTGETVANFSHEARGIKSGTGQWDSDTTRTYQHDNLRRFTASTDLGVDKFGNDTMTLDNFENPVGLVNIDSKPIRYNYGTSKTRNQIAAFSVQDSSLLSLSGAAFNEGESREWITMSFNMRPALTNTELDRGFFNNDFGDAYNSALGFGWLSENSQPFTLTGSVELGEYAKELLSYLPTADANDRFHWQVDLPNGDYRVKFAGKYRNNTTPETSLPVRLNIEGTPHETANFSNSPFISVTISDGNLSLSPDYTHPSIANLSKVDIRIPTQAIAKINFGSTTIIDGFTADSGLAYGTNSQTFGWLLNNQPTDVSVNADEQTIIGVDPKNSSYIPLQKNADSYTWEIALPNGTYFVQLYAGNRDDNNPNTDFNIQVEGIPLLKGWNTAYSEEEKNLFWLESPVVRVDVSDGKLTLTNGTLNAGSPDIDASRNELSQLRIWQYADSTQLRAQSSVQGSPQFSQANTQSPILLGSLDFSLVYDKRGRLIEDQSFTYTWDDFDRVTTATDKNYEDSKTSPEKVTYSYDAVGRRILYQYSAPINSSFDTTEWYDKRLVYNGIELIEEYNFSTDELMVKYFYESGLNYPISVDRKEGTVFKSYTVITDDRGSVMGVADENQNILEKNYYNTTGLLKCFDNDGTLLGYRSLYLDFGYTGMYKDPFTGRYHTHYRDFDPITNRWNMEDPAGYADGLNLYASYMGVNKRDPLGLFGMGMSDAYKAKLEYERWNAQQYASGHKIQSPMQGFVGSLLNSAMNQVTEMALGVKVLAHGEGEIARQQMIEDMSSRYLNVIQTSGNWSALGVAIADGVGVSRPMELFFNVDMGSNRHLTSMDKWQRGLELFGGFVLAGKGTQLNFANSGTKSMKGFRIAKNSIPRYLRRPGKVPATNSTAGTRGSRVMTEGEIQAVKDTGMLRGGNPGETYFTKDLYKSGTKAQERLSLPTKPTHRLEFEIKNNPQMQRNGTKVTPANGQPGKGSEFMTTDPVEVKILNIQPLSN
jgi:RHS repeat-associated protein